MEMGIDRIFEMLSWSNNEEIQELGIAEAKKIKNLSVLIKPIESKSIWENCARVLIEKDDQELEMYLIELFYWLQDMNWPGAYLIFDRLKGVPDTMIGSAYSFCLNLALQTKDYAWTAALKDFRNNKNCFA